MDGQTLISAAIEHWLDIGSGDSSDTTFRARCLLHLQEAAKARRSARQWSWRWATGSITVASSGAGDVPTDFASFGKEGWAIVAGQNTPMVWVPPRELFKVRAVSTGTSSTPTIYTLSGVDSTGNQQFQVGPQLPPGNITITAYYDSKCPAIADDTGTELLEAFPDEDYHETVLLNDVIAALQKDEGDLREPETRRMADRNDIAFWRDHKQGRHQRRRGPRYGAGVYR